MISRISKNSKRIIAVLSQYRSPSQIAWGIAIGGVLGLIPKDNLTALAILVLFAILRINQLAACCTAITIWMLSDWFYPVTYPIGSQLLSLPWVIRAIAFLYSFPVLPWTCLENALVIGGVAVGLVSVMPAYLLGRLTVANATKKLEDLALEQVANDAINYRKTVVDQSRLRLEKPTQGLKLAYSPTETRNGADGARLRSLNASVLLEPTRVDTTVSIWADQSVSSLYEVADESVPALGESHSRRQAEARSQADVVPTTFREIAQPIGNETILRETIIEIVRYKRAASVVTTPNADAPVRSQLFSHPSSQVEGTPMTVGNASTTVIAEKKNAQGKIDPKTGMVNSETTSIAYDVGHPTSPIGTRDESLRYLLRHIHSSRESTRKSTEKSA